MNETWWVGQDQLDEDQKDVIALPLGDSFLVTGPPGSGKTNILLLRANYLSLAGHPNVAVVVFTHALQDFIAAGGAKYAFSPERVMTSWRFAQQVLVGHGRHFAPSGDFEEQRTHCIEGLKSFIEEVDPGPLYDAILLDEAQDYLPDEISIFRYLAKQLFATADGRQKIYSGVDSLKILRESVDDEKVLKYHYRCGTKICRVADDIGKSWPNYKELAPESHYDEKARPSNAVPIKCDTEDEAFEAVIEKLKLQLLAYPDEWLGVIAPLQEDALRFWDHISQSDLADESVWYKDRPSNLFSDGRRIFVGTMHSAKGLEFRAVHVTGIEHLHRFTNRQRYMAFTTVTRAKTSFSLYIHSSWPGFLEQALRANEPIPNLPSLDDVFGSKK